MKFAAALSLAVAPLALAKAVHNVYPVVAARDQHEKGAASKNNDNSKSNDNNRGNQGQNIPAIINAGSTTSVIIIWVNEGGGAATSTINQQITVTQTVTAGAGAATGAVGATPIAGGAAAAVPTHSIEVGGAAGLSFTPQEIKAAVGYMVVFTFKNANHTATQSSFDLPCDPLAGGMDSGFQPNPNNTVNPPPQVAMQIMVETPLWFYCKQGNHCGKGMAFSINPTAEKTHAQFQANAIAQKGNGAGTAITGNATAPAVANPAASTTAGAAAGGAAGTAVATGSGSFATGVGSFDPATGVCTCAVNVAVAAFPAVAAQGLGSFGGFSGALPLALMERSP